jgi:hypothetical protein
MGLKFSKKDKVEELRVRQLPSPDDREEIVAVLTDEPDVMLIHTFFFALAFINCYETHRMLLPTWIMGSTSVI